VSVLEGRRVGARGKAWSWGLYSQGDINQDKAVKLTKPRIMMFMANPGMMSGTDLQRDRTKSLVRLI